MLKILNLFKIAIQEFKMVFKAVGTKHIYKNKRTIIKSIALCFIPFLYAFIALWAFFNPLGNINRLPIALVNNDSSAVGINRVINRHNLNLDNENPNSSGAYEFKINDLQINNEKKTFTVYYYDDWKSYYQHQNDKTFLTEIIINSCFTKDFNDFFKQAFKVVIDNIKTPKRIWNLINQITIRPKISLQASYKVSPILGEINDFALNALKDNIFSKFLPVVISDQVFDYWDKDASDSGYHHLQPILKEIYGILSIAVPGLGPHAEQFNDNIDSVTRNEEIKHIKVLEHDYWMNHTLLAPINFINFNINIEGQNKSPYGFGLGPYFMCIGMWVGTLLLTFTFIRNKDIPKTKFWSNYLAKSAWMIIFGLIQSTILVTSLLLLFNNIDLWQRFWQMFLYMWLIAIIFDLVVQSIAHMFRNHDLGRFLIVILLILQLSSSSGTFPVELEPKFFQVMYNFLPFSYAIKGLREILINPNPMTILWSIGCLLIFIIILVPLSLLLNWWHDHKDAKNEVGNKKNKLVVNDSSSLKNKTTTDEN
ncbi:YhgE/Pip family protein [Spiroplasma endosymbiont of Lasioglossum malachurum]|uniref:YhgE/Pip domain-containing protein n=1 Tax=Spiroplasma endosymbiont of Lasioglossum malachurum TaxID=3066319 RepID=UPI0030CB554A